MTKCLISTNKKFSYRVLIVPVIPAKQYYYIIILPIMNFQKKNPFINQNKTSVWLFLYLVLIYIQLLNKMGQLHKIYLFIKNYYVFDYHKLFEWLHKTGTFRYFNSI